MWCIASLLLAWNCRILYLKTSKCNKLHLSSKNCGSSLIMAERKESWRFMMRVTLFIYEVSEELTVQREEGEVIYCLFICCPVQSSFCACGERQTNTTTRPSSCHPPTFLISCSAGKPCCLCDCYIRQSIIKSVGPNCSSDYLFPCFVDYWHRESDSTVSLLFQSFHTLNFMHFSLFFSLPAVDSFSQPPLFSHQIPFLHNYHLLILNESPNTLHGFNTAC